MGSCNSKKSSADNGKPTIKGKEIKTGAKANKSGDTTKGEKG